MLLMMKVYIKPSCPWCIDALAWLRAKNYQFEHINVLSDSSAYDRMIQISGQALTPTLELPEGDVLPDFDTGQLEEFLAERGLLQ